MFLINLVLLAVPDHLHDILHNWGRPGHIGMGLDHWPTDFTRDILPKPCHSHNDYWREVPLYSAIEAGCIGVEADIWLFEEELYVGHSIASLTPNRTLGNLYINPLLDILAKQNQAPVVIPARDPPKNGIFDTTPEETLIFLIDFKTSGLELFPHVVGALEPLRSRGYLSYQNGSHHVRGPITVVGTGNTPFEMVLSETENLHRDIFFDAPLDKLYEASTDASRHGSRHPLVTQGLSPDGETFRYNSTNSLYASVSFEETIGHLHGGRFSEEQLDKIRGQVRGAHRQGLKARYWETPGWPISLRNHVWTVLIREEADILNVDDLKGATQGDWSKGSGWAHGYKERFATNGRSTP